VPLSTPGEEAEYADGGLLVVSKRVVFGSTLFKFESNEHGARFYGQLTCDHFHDLLNKDEPVLTATRDGINWKHPFAKALKDAVEKRLEPIVEEERRRAQAEERNVVNRRLKEKLDIAMKELNAIAKTELGRVDGDEAIDDPRTAPQVPSSGFGFVPEYAHIQTGRIARLTLRGSIPEQLETGSLITIESDSTEVSVITPQVVIEALQDYPNVGEAHVELEGRQVGAEAIITARLEGLLDGPRAEAWVKVISKRVIVLHPRPPQQPRGLFKEIRFDPTAEPRQRVRFDHSNSLIVIATKSPSVAPYLDETGKGSDTAQGQVMLAELITEAVCNEIARRGVKKGTYLAPKGGETDAIRRKYIELQNQYGYRIHSCFVDGKYRRGDYDIQRKKGRPPRDEVLEKAVTAI
jgi:hypothetical protein